MYIDSHKGKVGESYKMGYNRKVVMYVKDK